MVQGEGSRHRRAGEWPGDNVRIETNVGIALADRIVEHTALEEFHNCAVIVFVSDVGVVRGEKYV